MSCVICEITHAHTHTQKLIWTHSCTTPQMYSKGLGYAHRNFHTPTQACRKILFISWRLPSKHLPTTYHTYPHKLCSRRYAKESECFLLLNAAPSEPPVNRPDYFIMNLNLSSRAVSSDRSLGLTNAPGYFWQHKNPQNMESFHISILSNNLSHY